MGGAHPDWHAAVEAVECSKVEGVLLLGFGDLGLERPGDVGSDERITSGETGVCAELLLHTFIRGVIPQAGCHLPAVLNRKQAKVAVSLLEHEVVSLPDLFRGGAEGEPCIGGARLEKGSLCCVYWMAGLCSHKLGEGGVPGAHQFGKKESCPRYGYFL